MVLLKRKKKQEKSTLIKRAENFQLNDNMWFNPQRDRVYTNFI